jgi:hypothetical protein
MKTSVEINGYTISIEEREGVISVNAVKEDEVVEEFTIQIEEGEESDDDDDDEFESQDEEDKVPEGALESFQSFINKKK